MRHIHFASRLFVSLLACLFLTACPDSDVSSPPQPTITSLQKQSVSVITLQNFSEQTVTIDGKTSDWQGVVKRVQELRNLGHQTVAFSMTDSAAAQSENSKAFLEFITMTGVDYWFHRSNDDGESYFKNVEWIELDEGPESNTMLGHGGANLSKEELTQLISKTRANGKRVYLVCKGDMVDSQANRSAWSTFVKDVNADVGIRNLQGQPGRAFQVGE